MAPDGGHVGRSSVVGFLLRAAGRTALQASQAQAKRSRVFGWMKTLLSILLTASFEPCEHDLLLFSCRGGCVRLNDEQKGRRVLLWVSGQIWWKLSVEGVWVGGLYQYSPPRMGGHHGGRGCSGGGILKGR